MGAAHAHGAPVARAHGREPVSVGEGVSAGAVAVAASCAAVGGQGAGVRGHGRAPLVKCKAAQAFAPAGRTQASAPARGEPALATAAEGGASYEVVCTHNNPSDTIV